MWASIIVEDRSKLQLKIIASNYYDSERRSRNLKKIIILDFLDSIFPHPCICSINFNTRNYHTFLIWEIFASRVRKKFLFSILWYDICINNDTFE